MKRILISLTLLIFNNQLLAQNPSFNTGPVFDDFGAHAPVQQTAPLSKDSHFKIAFDVAKKAPESQRNRSMESAARFINMQVAAGVDVKNIELAVVVHGQAVQDLVKPGEGQSSTLQSTMIQQLVRHGVRFYVCGQSAAYYQVRSTDLLPGINMSLSAMTAHALLQQEGYSLNPF